MARNPPHQNSGILSNVFSFVSRELESFVANATGGDISDPGPSKPRKNIPPKSRKSCEENQVSRKRHQLSNMEKVHHTIIDNSTLPQSPSIAKHARGKSNILSQSTRPKTYSRGTHRSNSPKNHSAADPASEELSASDRSPSSSPTPPPLSRTLKRRQSITMPGSFLPRSSSLEPELDHGASHALLSISAQGSESGPSFTAPKSLPESTSAITSDTDGQVPVAPSPWRLNAVSSVKDAIDRFHAGDAKEADFSLLLPSPDNSPVKGKAIAGISTTHKPSSKGKEKERSRVDDSFSFDLDADTSGVIRVRNKQRELDGVLRDRDEQDIGSAREKDKEKIRELEDEIRRLKEELSRQSRQRLAADATNIPPPPPPPLPPPLPVRIPLGTSHGPTDPNMFLSARAALRHTNTPVEAPINAVLRTKRQGQPTVNVPSDKMAAFLNEMKTVRLRKVGSGAIPGPSNSSRNGVGSSVAGPSGLSRSVSSGSTRLPTSNGPRRNSTSVPSDIRREAVVRTGEKRKIDAIGGDNLEDVLRAAVRRRSNNASDTSASLTSLAASNPRAANASSTSSTRNQTWPSISASANETDITTPSLCSDNEDREGNGSLEDRLPSTPPGPRTSLADFRRKTAGYRDREVIDVDMLDDEISTQPTRVPGSPRIRRPSNELFTKRPPMSPITVPTPRKIKPPARTRRGATPKPKAVALLDSEEDGEDDEDPLSLTFPLAKKDKTPTRPGPTQRKPRDIPQQKSRRRWTLDEELRDARARSSDDGLDSGVLVGVGTRSKRKGFLAHGGAGGSPVFMGVGYVQGAEESEEEYIPKRTSRSRTRKS
ncbi:hypothetical protein BJ138DRAFT_1171990 [Hygrophoropsis aurantiaca]|uniref:Uncharacterized protein n=1 Tax=Hygrophoropsis aurantiaca TaxID=72124 RepID=A0ACB8AG43_9AGAM|nr:hypothetical protein BJ138DRAFT_1171990 [Hygrophoropsis aurantiaca]